MTDDQYRGLLTDREREILINETDVPDSYYSRVVSRIRTKIERFEDDAEMLAEHHPELHQRLLDSVCRDDT